MCLSNWKSDSKRGHLFTGLFGGTIKSIGKAYGVDEQSVLEANKFITDEPWWCAQN